MKRLGLAGLALLAGLGCANASENHSSSITYSVASKIYNIESSGLAYSSSGRDSSKYITAAGIDAEHPVKEPLSECVVKGIRVIDRSGDGLSLDDTLETKIDLIGKKSLWKADLGENFLSVSFYEKAKDGTMLNRGTIDLSASGLKVKAKDGEMNMGTNILAGIMALGLVGNYQQTMRYLDDKLGNCRR